MQHRIYENVDLKGEGTIQPFCLIGVNSGDAEETNQTVVGSNYNIRSGTVIYSGNEIGNSFQTGHHVLIRENNRIGNGVSIGSGSDVEYNVKIGDGVRVHSQAFIPEYSILHDNCWIGPNVVLTNAKYPRSKGVKDNLEGPTVEEHAIIGSNATILPGLDVGKYSLVGAGSVVTEDVPEGSVVTGNPARVKGRIADLKRDSSAGRGKLYSVEEKIDERI